MIVFSVSWLAPPLSSFVWPCWMAILARSQAISCWCFFFYLWFRYFFSCVVVAIACHKFVYCLAVPSCNAIAPIIKCEWLIVVQYIQVVLTLRCCVAHWNEFAQNKTNDVLDDTKLSLDTGYPLLFVYYIHPPFSST